ncbi:uncharacterized protein NECHADRAFT_84967 [Fusarium vanettenii 77-13-4]|uniref:Uncharacterized protein n=1 Tax=Fusarium vanettenii (strain ATCC MYA-4622 / CBS 123669 / FGSC 9596 / NRRL 45880 / 77-13-4) TaxID=660122 RepID=C7YUL9_FUSV7|nr:uncharacterized protein NECHADRAFT_84967 [Fusarium vanettenii 77-13-4]EEU44433.1 hypothetical protein NECHADRAFT_84967 [Fusarium vanettenii 77-13-4]
MSNMPGGKPPRMRSACTSCHAAKSDMTCTYEVSLVGRMTKKRRRQRCNGKAHNTDHDTSVECLYSLSRSVSCRGQDCLDPCKLAISSPGCYDDPSAQHPYDHTLDQPRNDNPQPQYSTIEFRDDSAYGSYSEIESILPCLRQADILPLSPDSTWLSPSTSDSPPKEQWSPEPQPTSIISELSTLLESLETQTRSKSRGLDEILQTNRACMTSLGKILTTSEYYSYRSGGILVVSALELIIYSFEEAVKSQGWGSEPSSQTSGSLSSVKFGVFEVDPEEQVAIVKRIVSKELQNCLEIVRNLAGELHRERQQKNQNPIVHG